VVQHDREKGGIGPVAVVDPVRELVMPDEVVATDLSDVVSVGECNKLVGLAEVKDTLGLFGEFVFHDVGRCPLVELMSVSSNSQVDRVRTLALGYWISKGLSFVFFFFLKR